MKKYLILLAGPPATGKSYLASLIVNALPKTYVLSPDEFKEDMADSIGFNNLPEKAELEKRVWYYYYKALDIYMSVGKQFILTEYPFSFKQKDHLRSLTDKHHYLAITVRLTADFDVLWLRRKARDIDQNRHLSHIMTHYHYGDRLADRSEADNLINKEAFRKIIEDRKYNDFVLGKLYELDVTDFSKVHYDLLINDFINDIDDSKQ